LDWFVAPKSQRKGSVALDNIYVRLQTEKNALVVGQYGRPKEFKMKYEGPNTKIEVQRWYDALTLAIDNYKKKKLENGGENFKLIVNQGNETTDDFLQGNNQIPEETITTTTVVNNPPPQQQQTQIIQTSQPQTYVQPQPMVQQTYVQPQPMVQQTYVQPQPMVQQTVYTNPQPMVQQTFVQPQPQQMTTSCQFCRVSFSGSPVNGYIRCPYCFQVNNLNPPPPQQVFTTTPQVQMFTTTPQQIYTTTPQVQMFTTTPQQMYTTTTVGGVPYY